MNLKMLRRFLQDEIGVESAEYAMILVWICAAIIAAVIALASGIKARFNSATNLFNNLP